MYFEASNRQDNAKALLRFSPKSGSSTSKCLRFFYHMYGSEMGTLSVYQVERFRVDLKESNEIWTKFGKINVLKFCCIYLS